jgi:hypothetical protein
MRCRTLIIILVVLVLGAGVAGGLYWRWLNSPRYALQQMALALKEKNMDGFFKYVDLKEIFNQIVAESAKEREAPPSDKPEDEWTKATRRLGQKFARQILPKIFDSFSRQIRSLIENQLLNLNNSQILGVMAAVTVAKIDSRGDKAQVTLKDHKTGEPFRFQMRRYPDGNWRIVSINHEDLKKFWQCEWPG